MIIIIIILSKALQQFRLSLKSSLLETYEYSCKTNLSSHPTRYFAYGSDSSSLPPFFIVLVSETVLDRPPEVAH